ncbi:MAG: hypothetical protein JM57_10895 [Comamonadaceae bacterium BICA1-1]|nr:MAG: hypothetical protein JM57_10895 [Comamonadaceae bacterium BICA1-1]
MRPMPDLAQRQRPLGLTLIEVLVALAIVAISLTAGLQASAALTRLAERQSQQWLAQLCADNALVNLRLQPQFPAVGRSNHSCEQGGRAFQVTLDISPTLNPSFRRVHAEVQGPGAAPDAAPVQLLTLLTVIGRH